MVVHDIEPIMCMDNRKNKKIFLVIRLCDKKIVIVENGGYSNLRTSALVLLSKSVFGF